MSLAITRKVGQRVKVGEAWVEVSHISGGQVKLRIDAPRDVKILREELERIESPLVGELGAPG
jgi:carbon storage regulator CsrA